MEATADKTIDKIRKLLALSLNNTSAEEATAAALKAQEMMAKNGVTIADLEDDAGIIAEKIEIAKYDCGNGHAWKFSLAHVVAENFRCKNFSYGKSTIAFYGYETDAMAAKEVFAFLFKMGNKLSYNAAKRVWANTGSCAGVANSFLRGFVAGVKSELDKQCVALMIIMAPEVKEQYSDFIKGAKTISTGMRMNGYDREAYSNGFSEGKRAMGKR